MREWNISVFIIHHNILYSIFTLSKCIHHSIFRKIGEFLLFHEYRDAWKGKFLWFSFISVQVICQFYDTDWIRQKKSLYAVTSCYYLKYKRSNFLDLENTATIATSPPLSPSTLGPDCRMTGVGQWNDNISESSFYSWVTFACNDNISFGAWHSMHLSVNYLPYIKSWFNRL